MFVFKPLKHCKKKTLQKKMKFSIKNFLSKCDQIRRNLRIASHLLEKSLMKNSIFCAVKYTELNIRKPHMNQR